MSNTYTRREFYCGLAHDLCQVFASFLFSRPAMPSERRVQRTVALSYFSTCANHCPVELLGCLWAGCRSTASYLGCSDADRVALPDELSTLTALTTLHLAFLDAFVPVDSYQLFPLAAPGLRFLSLTGQTVFQNLTYRRGQLPHLGQLTGASLQHCRAPPCSARSLCVWLLCLPLQACDVGTFIFCNVCSVCDLHS